MEVVDDPDQLSLDKSENFCIDEQNWDFIDKLKRVIKYEESLYRE